jgi:hypothetical protein
MTNKTHHSDDLKPKEKTVSDHLKLKGVVNGNAVHVHVDNKEHNIKFTLEGTGVLTQNGKASVTYTPVPMGKSHVRVKADSEDGTKYGGLAIAITYPKAPDEPYEFECT